LSTKTGAGVDDVRCAIARALTGGDSLKDTAAVSNMRHIGLLGQAREYLVSACEAAAARASEEFVVSDLLAARTCFDEIVGARTSDDVLEHVFERFCIGK
jgi:tRNA modification GTPase